MHAYKAEHASVQYPFYLSCVQAGFPSPADDHIESQLDLNALLIKQPSATFMLRSDIVLACAGIQVDDVLVVDRSLPAVHGSVVVAVMMGELVVRQLYRQQGCMMLCSDELSIAVTNRPDVLVWGVVSYVIHRVS